MVDEAEAVRSKYARRVPATVEELTRAHAKAGRRYWAPELRRFITARHRAGESASKLAAEYGTTRLAILGIAHREKWGWRRTNGQSKQLAVTAEEKAQSAGRVKAVTLAPIRLLTLSDHE